MDEIVFDLPAYGLISTKLLILHFGIEISTVPVAIFKLFDTLYVPFLFHSSISEFNIIWPTWGMLYTTHNKINWTWIQWHMWREWYANSNRLFELASSQRLIWTGAQADHINTSLLSAHSQSQVRTLVSTAKFNHLNTVSLNTHIAAAEMFPLSS